MAKTLKANQLTVEKAVFLYMHQYQPVADPKAFAVVENAVTKFLLPDTQISDTPLHTLTTPMINAWQERATDLPAAHKAKLAKRADEQTVPRLIARARALLAQALRYVATIDKEFTPPAIENIFLKPTRKGAPRTDWSKYEKDFGNVEVPPVEVRTRQRGKKDDDKNEEAEAA